MITDQIPDDFLTSASYNYFYKHMVLSYKENKDSDALILDNLIGKIKKEENRRDLDYKYSFNDTGLWNKKNNKYLGTADNLTM